VPLGAGSARVEADPVVFQAEHDVVVLLADRDPHVPGLSVFEGVHHALASDVIHEQGDGGRELDVLHVAMEADRGIATDLIGERFERLRESFRPQRGSMQVSDECTDPIRRLLLRLADLVELHADVVRLPLLEQLPRDINLDGQPEQHLGEIVMEVSSDLESFIGPLLGHGVRERTKDLLTNLKFLVGLLERLRSEEHLARQ